MVLANDLLCFSSIKSPILQGFWDEKKHRRYFYIYTRKWDFTVEHFQNRLLKLWEDVNDVKIGVYLHIT